MSNNLPETNKPEEIDLGHVFNYIERGIRALFKLIKRVFGIILWVLNKILILILFSLNIFQKHFLKVALTGALGFFMIFGLQRSERDEYVSNIIVTQNFSTGELLYNNIAIYNNLAQSGDSTALAKELGIKPEIASKITGFFINDKENKNKLIEDYYEFKKIDTLLTISLNEYISQRDSENYSIQDINVFSTSTEIYDGLSKQILSAINKNSYFNVIKRNDSINTVNKIKDLEEIIKDSDTLKTSYVKLLNQYYGNFTDNGSNDQSTINLNLSSSKDRITTKEFELLNSIVQHKKEITVLKDILNQKNNIVELQKDFSIPTKKSSSYKGKSMYATILFVMLAMLYFLIKELEIGERIKNYGSKEKLFDK